MYCLSMGIYDFNAHLFGRQGQHALVNELPYHRSIGVCTEVSHSIDVLFMYQVGFVVKWCFLCLYFPSVLCVVLSVGA